MSRIYISGKITGLEHDEYRAKFDTAEQILIDKGHYVINPARVNDALPDCTTYDEYMAMSMLELSMCDTIFMLDNWKDSPGANTELNAAVANNKVVMFESVEREEGRWPEIRCYA